MRCKSALRGIYFIPNILGGLVVGYIFSFIFTYILPTIGNVTGIGFLQNSMLASTKTAWLAIVIVGGMAGHSNEYHYIYIGTSDSAGRGL